MTYGGSAIPRSTERSQRRLIARFDGDLGLQAGAIAAHRRHRQRLPAAAVGEGSNT